MFENVIKHYPDFPKPGIDFIDVLPFLQDKEAFRQAVNEIDRLSTAPNMATVEARGFLFGAPLLSVSEHVKTLVPFRKKGKLPHAEGDLVRVEIEKEYGSDELFYRLSDFAACQHDLASYTMPQIAIINEGIYQTLELGVNSQETEAVGNNLVRYIRWMLSNGRQEAIAHFASFFENATYPNANAFIMIDCREALALINQMISDL